MKWKDFEKDGCVKLDELAAFYDEKSKLYKTTHGYQMVRNFVLDQVLSEEFQRKVREIRKKYSVPDIGYKYPVIVIEDRDNLSVKKRGVI